MGVLQRFERRLEGIVGVAFARVFKGKVHPAEIAKALEREATEQKVVVGEGRVLVPNRYVVRLGPVDYEYLGEWEVELSATMAEMVQEHVEAEGWSTFGKIRVALARDGDLRTGVFHVDSRVDADAAQPPPAPMPRREPRDAASTAPPVGAPVGLPPVPPAQPGPLPSAAPRSPGPERPAAAVPPPAIPAAAAPPPAIPAAAAPPPAAPMPPAAPLRNRNDEGGGPPGAPGVGGGSVPAGSSAPMSYALVVDGPNTRHELREGSNVIGRGTEASIRLPDTGVSRRHVDVQLARGKATVVDLGSTNGTIVNGRRVPQILLSDGDVIRIGHSVLVYRQEPRPGWVP